MKILFASSEAVPYIKTGGLGDVVGTLALELAKHGHEVAIAIPLYTKIKEQSLKLKVAVSIMEVPMGNCSIWCRVWEKKGDHGLRIFFIEHDQFFHRNPIYDDGEKEYSDNGARFAFFSKATLDLARHIDFRPDIVHCNDWQTALVPYYLKCWGWGTDFFAKTGSVMTIHNMGYQGWTDMSLAPFIGLTGMQIRPDEFEALHALNLLKGAFFYADQITTVSPTYAQEILTEPGGGGLSTFLSRRKQDVIGILNGIDTEEWNPKTDAYLNTPFNAQNQRGKSYCKIALQKEFGLEVNAKVPISGMVGRLAAQKGLDILRDCIHEVLQWELQFVILGSGDPELSHFFRELPGQYPGKVGSYVGFDPYLAHIIEAGSDCFIMPSRYEPCGLNQMYSLLYGAVPIVRATGGLADTVQNYDPINDTGTGFMFHDFTADALKNTIGWALDTWYNAHPSFLRMRTRGMHNDFGWKKAVDQYENAYKQAMKRRASW